MHEAETPLVGARLVVLGSAGLTEGFSLIGAEVHAGCRSGQGRGRSWRNWSRRASQALVLLETHLAHAGGHWLNRLRNEGGRIVVTELPPLAAPHDYAPAVDEVVRAVLGPEALT